jgi:hypothetical protein
MSCAHGRHASTMNTANSQNTATKRANTVSKHPQEQVLSDVNKSQIHTHPQTHTPLLPPATALAPPPPASATAPVCCARAA